VVRDAHERGRNRVDLEVDAESPTGADGLYSSMGWTVKYRTESWHAEV
jgi:mycothiol synthase